MTVNKVSQEETFAAVNDLSNNGRGSGNISNGRLSGDSDMSNQINHFLDRVIKQAIYTSTGICKYQNNLISTMGYYELRQVIRLFYKWSANTNETASRHFGNYTQLSTKRMQELLTEWKKSKLPSYYLDPRTCIYSLKRTIKSFSYSEEGGYSYTTDLW